MTPIRKAPPNSAAVTAAAIDAVLRASPAAAPTAACAAAKAAVSYGADRNTWRQQAAAVVPVSVAVDVSAAVVPVSVAVDVWTAESGGGGGTWRRWTADPAATDAANGAAEAQLYTENFERFFHLFSASNAADATTTTTTTTATTTTAPVWELPLDVGPRVWSPAASEPEVDIPPAQVATSMWL